MDTTSSTIWVLFAAAMAFFMQSGSALVERGMTGTKNVGSPLKNLIDAAIGTPVSWLFGFGILSAGGRALIGGSDYLGQGARAGILPAGGPRHDLLNRLVICSPFATTVSRVMAERAESPSMGSPTVYPVSRRRIGDGWPIWAMTTTSKRQPSPCKREPQCGRERRSADRMPESGMRQEIPGCS